MKLSQIMQDVEIVAQSCDLNMEISDVCYNSRKAGPGTAFVAVRGFQTDGHKYIGSAVQNGAAVIVAETAPEENVPYVLVANSRRALAQMSNNFFGRPADSMKLIGVTGTNGKTTVTNLIRTVLEYQGEKCGLIGTNENRIGSKVIPSVRTTPESYDLFALLAEMRDAGCGYAILEVSSHSLALDRVYGLEFEAAVFTNLSRDHLDFHEDMDDYLRAKAKLFDRCKNAVINYDDAAGQKLIANKKCHKLTYSAKDNNADLVAKNLQLRSSKVEFEAVTTGFINRISLGIPGTFTVYNALATIGCCLTLGIDLSIIAAALRTAKGVKGRVEVVPTGTEYTIIIDYAHSPDGMENVLKAVRGFARGRIISVFGCGGDRDRSKRPIMGRMGAQYSDVCVITSDNPRSEDPNAIIEEILPGTSGCKTQLHVIPDRRQAIAFAMNLAEKDDIVLLMGKGHETYQEICGEKLHFDEREEIARILQEQQKAL